MKKQVGVVLGVLLMIVLAVLYFTVLPHMVITLFSIWGIQLPFWKVAGTLLIAKGIEIFWNADKV